MYPVIPAIAIASALNWLPCSPAELDAFTKHGDVWWKICWGPNRPDSTLAVGTVNKQVAFVVINSHVTDKEPVRASRNTQLLPSGDTLSKTEAFLALPSGMVRLPLRHQLIEVADGKVRFSDRRLTLAEVDAYLSSAPPSYSLAGLLRFVDKRRTAKEP